jgi:hypothetical protein
MSDRPRANQAASRLPAGLPGSQDEHISSSRQTRLALGPGPPCACVPRKRRLRADADRFSITMHTHGRRKMKGFVRATCIAALIVPAIAMAADKQYGCDEVNWGEEVLKAFPNASKGCHSVMMKNNQPYAKYVGEVQSANASEVVLHMLDAKDKAMSKLVIAPKEGAHVKIDGKDVAVAKLKKGDRVSFYIPHDRWGLYADPESTPITIVSREDL